MRASESKGVLPGEGDRTLRLSEEGQAVYAAACATQPAGSKVLVVVNGQVEALTVGSVTWAVSPPAAVGARFAYMRLVLARTSQEVTGAQVVVAEEDSTLGETVAWRAHCRRVLAARDLDAEEEAARADRRAVDTDNAVLVESGYSLTRKGEREAVEFMAVAARVYSGMAEESFGG